MHLQRFLAEVDVQHHRGPCPPWVNRRFGDEECLMVIGWLILPNGARLQVRVLGADLVSLMGEQKLEGPGRLRPGFRSPEPAARRRCQHCPPAAGSRRSG